jgi:hypothetical protein
MNHHSNKDSKDFQHSLVIGNCQPYFAVRVAQTKVRLLFHQVHEIPTVVRYHHIYAINTSLHVSASDIANQVGTINNILIVA